MSDYDTSRVICSKCGKVIIFDDWYENCAIAECKKCGTHYHLRLFENGYDVVFGSKEEMDSWHTERIREELGE